MECGFFSSTSMQGSKDKTNAFVLPGYRIFPMFKLYNKTRKVWRFIHLMSSQRVVRSGGARCVLGGPFFSMAIIG